MGIEYRYKMKNTGGSSTKYGPCEVARYTVIDHEDLFNPAALTSVEYESFRHCLHRIEQHRVKSGKRAKIDLRTLVKSIEDD